MDLSQIYKPIEKELRKVEEVLETSLGKTKNESILELNQFLLESGGKRIRPAMVILSSKATLSKEQRAKSKELIKIASSIELIHMASLIHDDVIDHACMRHNRPSVNSKWGNEVSIALGDYLYSKAFELIADCKNTEVLSCLAQAMAAMCEGELIQVKERDNLELKKRQYLVIVKKKTASLMASCCRAGVALIKGELIYKEALTNYGLNFGIAFQVMDDYLDLTSNPQELGKPTGLDLAMGELTLPVLNLIAEYEDKNRIISLIKNPDRRFAFKEMKQIFLHSQAHLKTRQTLSFYIRKAKDNLNMLIDSPFKESLSKLADYMEERANL